MTGNRQVGKATDPIGPGGHELLFRYLRNTVPTGRSRIARNARVMESPISEFTMVRRHAENGSPLTSVHDVSFWARVTEITTPYVRMYVMQILRFLARVVSNLGDVAAKRRIEVIPNMSEFFAIFNNDDRCFERRKTWSIYRA